MTTRHHNPPQAPETSCPYCQLPQLSEEPREPVLSRIDPFCAFGAVGSVLAGWLFFALFAQSLWLGFTSGYYLVWWLVFWSLAAGCAVGAVWDLVEEWLR